MINPTPKAIKKARQEAGHTQSQAAETIGKHMRAWQKWEYGTRPMDPAIFELYLLKSGVAVKYCSQWLHDKSESTPFDP